MHDTLVGREVRRTTRNVIVWNVLLLAIMARALFLSAGYLHNLLAGPFPLSAEDLTAGKTPDAGTCVRVDGKDTIKTEWQDITQKLDKHTRRVISEKVTASYSLLVVDKKLLVVRHNAEAWTGNTVAGRLVPMPPEKQNTFVNAAIANQPELRDAFLRPMLDATSGWGWPGYVGLSIGILLALWALRNLRRSSRFRSNPYCHPEIAKLAERGDTDEQIAALENQSDDSEQLGKVRFTPHWMIQSKHLRFDLVPLVDLAWGTLIITQHRTNGVPSGKSFEVKFYDLSRREYSFTVPSEERGEDLIRSVIQRVPWVLLGSNELQATWQASPLHVIGIVQDRRMEYLKMLANGEIPAAEPKTEGEP